jgi:large repetitive protein
VGIASFTPISPYSSLFSAATTTTLTYTATNFAGLTASCVFTVSVIDQEAPVLSRQCPSSQMVYTDPGSTTSSFTFDPPLFTDNVDSVLLGTLAVISSETHEGITTSPCFLCTEPLAAGIYSFKYSAIDSAGNINPGCNFTITVFNFQGAYFTGCQSDAILSTAEGSAFAAYTMPPIPSFFNSLGASVQVVANQSNSNNIQSWTPVSGNSYLVPVGDYFFSFTANDGMGSTATCSYTVTVSDIQPPVFNCETVRASISSVPMLASTAQYCFCVPLAVDNSGAPCNPCILSDYHVTCPTLGSAQCQPTNFVNPYPLGSCGVGGKKVCVTTGSPGNHTIEFSAQDRYGNVGFCAITLSFYAIVAPVVTNCPSSVILEASNSSGTIITWVAPSAVSAISEYNPLALIIPSVAPGSLFPLGRREVIYIIRDRVGNNGLPACRFNITVRDTTPPRPFSIASLPLNRTVSASNSSSTALVCGF